MGYTGQEVHVKYRTATGQIQNTGEEVHVIEVQQKYRMDDWINRAIFKGQVQNRWGTQGKKYTLSTGQLQDRYETQVKKYTLLKYRRSTERMIG